MTSKQEQAIRAHGENLLRIFPNAAERDPIALCKKLRRFEAQANAIALRLCNGPAFDFPDQADRKIDGIIDRVCMLLGNTDNAVPIFCNRDPRGYALKIADSYLRNNPCRIHQDWGGYGILAPEIGKDGN